MVPCCENLRKEARSENVLAKGRTGVCGKVDLHMKLSARAKVITHT